MVYHFIIISGEVEDFSREIAIDENSTFLTFHNAIQDSVQYDKSQMASFFEIDDDYNKIGEITLMDMGDMSDMKPRLMDEVKLNEVFTSVKEKMIYEFDFFNGRGFYIQLQTLIDKSIDMPVLLKSEGNPPEQLALAEEGFDELEDLRESEDLHEDYDDMDDIRFEDMDIEDLDEFI